PTRQPGPVARRPGDRPAECLHDEQRGHRGEAPTGELRHERLRLSITGVDRVHDLQLAGSNLGRHRRSQRFAPHGPRHVLLIAVRRWAERLAAALPLGRADRALTGAAGALLLPRLLATARHFAATLGVVSAGAAIGQLARHRLMEQRHPHLDAEHLWLEIERATLATLCTEDCDGRHHFFSVFCCCWAFVIFTLLRIITRLPLAPGTAPRSRSRLCSGRTR